MFLYIILLNLHNYHDINRNKNEIIWCIVVFQNVMSCLGLTEESEGATRLRSECTATDIKDSGRGHRCTVQAKSDTASGCRMTILFTK